MRARAASEDSVAAGASNQFFISDKSTALKQVSNQDAVSITQRLAKLQVMNRSSAQ